MLIGAFIGVFTVAFVGVQEPAIVLGAMIVGAVVVYFLGTLK